MINIVDKSKCCGCGVCVDSCVKNAISMIEDEQGFLFPFVNAKECINCGICNRTCDFIKNHQTESTIKNIYSLQHKSLEVLKHSSSGGAFTALSELILNSGGVVYGAYLNNDDFSVCHKSARSYSERDVFKESKYVQSSTVGIFKDIKMNLEHGYKVLFSGTPCQCAALKSFVKNKNENLYLIDLLCHGVPSNKIFKEHVNMWERKKNKKAVNYHFRSKIYGYVHTHLIEFNDNTKEYSIELKRILKLYTLTMRPSCYSCPYASQHRYGDITIGDLWECNKVANIFNNLGASTVIVNTDKGRELIKDISNSCNIKKISINVRNIGALSQCVKKTDKVNQFWNYYKNNGYEKALNKFAPRTLKSSVYQSMLRMIHVCGADSIYCWLKSFF